MVHARSVVIICMPVVLMTISVAISEEGKIYIIVVRVLKRACLNDTSGVHVDVVHLRL